MGNYNLKSIISKPLLQHVLLANDACLMPLFHGTDMAVFQMTPEARAELRKYCGIVIDQRCSASPLLQLCGLRYIFGHKRFTAVFHRDI